MNPKPNSTRQLAKKLLVRVPKLRPYIQRKEHLEGEVVALAETVQALQKRNDLWAEEVRTLRGEHQTREIIWPVRPEDILAADYRKPYHPPAVRRKPPFSVNWVVPPMGPVSGGHADIFRAINHLESRKHSCRIYFYDPLRQSSPGELKRNMRRYAPVAAPIVYNARSIAPSDALVATSWHTAYPVFIASGSVKKFYFVQDFEPFFDPVGSYSTLAETTYRFGLHGITLGSWLKQKLSTEYGMKCDAIELGVEPDHYHLLEPQPRRGGVLFYARPVTPRRGFEMGILALEAFHRRNPSQEIHMVGWDLSQYKIPFPYVDHGILSHQALNQLYNHCIAGLVLSFTNMSLLPLEMMAAGCQPVMNDAPHTRLASYRKLLVYSSPTPQALADSLHAAVTETTEARVHDLANQAERFQWSQSYATLEQILVRELSA